MDIASTNPQLIIDFYGVCFTLLFWVSAVLACVVFLALSLLLWFEIQPADRKATRDSR